MSWTQITVSLAGRIRTISDYAESSPKELRELLVEVDRVSDSHRWRHGNPRLESITHVDSDSYLPKPGVTPLMLAAGRNEIDQVKTLIAAGADVNAKDASGWTPLMYAASASASPAAGELLKAGANPNQASPHGDTALMVEALSRSWDSGFVKFGAHVNARNQEGQTALMMLATRAEPDEIARALRDGADPFLKDKLGRTALDYLRLASCGKGPFRDRFRENVTYTRCNVFDPDDVKKAKKSLTAAMRVRR
jgi:hypothetical protein